MNRQQQIKKAINNFKSEHKKANNEYIKYMLNCAVEETNCNINALELSRYYLQAQKECAEEAEAAGDITCIEAEDIIYVATKIAHEIYFHFRELDIIDEY